MRTTRLTLTLAFLCFLAKSPAPAVTIDMVTVGDPGNVADTTGYGVVAEVFQMGKYEVTIGQYAEFLNAVAKSDPNNLYDSLMATDATIAGISRAGTAGEYSYSVIGPSGATLGQSGANRPVTYVNWFDAARFANWLSNGQPSGSQGPNTTENGAYALNGAVSGTAPAANTTNPNTGQIPLFRLPTENEWYKAAYYRGGSSIAGYWGFATMSDVAPGNVVGSETNQANYRLRDNGPYSVTQSSTYSPLQNYLTDVGAFTGSPSAYGTFDQSGNVWEWNDLAGEAGVLRCLRGGYWSETVVTSMSSSTRYEYPASDSLSHWGFRVAAPVAVPEPSTRVIGAVGLTCAALGVFTRRKRA